MARRTARGSARFGFADGGSDIDADGNAGSGDSGDTGGGSGDRGSDGAGDGRGSVEPAAVFGGVDTGGAGDLRDGDADDYIRDADGNLTYSPTGRVRKRRAKSGPRKARTVTAKKVPVDGLARLLALAHLTLANVTHVPEIEINDNEAKMLAVPMAELFELYDIPIDPRVLRTMELVGAMSYVYGPRVYMFKMRKASEKADKQKQAKDARDKAGAVATPSVGGVDVFSNTGGMEFMNIQPGKFS